VVTLVDTSGHVEYFYVPVIIQRAVKVSASQYGNDASDFRFTKRTICEEVHLVNFTTARRARIQPLGLLGTYFSAIKRCPATSLT
jgi:hypothetical protein